MIFQFPSGPRHTALPPTAPLSTVIWQDTWAWPHITDMESIDITHDLPTIHGGRDRILWTGPRGSFSSAAAYDLFRPPGPTVGWSSLLVGTFHIPRHRFILWLALQGRLSTTDKPWRFGCFNLVFADDLILFSRADANSIQLFKDGLTVFSELSGLQANLAKSHLILSRSAAASRDTLLAILGFQEGHLPLRYLGLPLLASRLTIADCQPILQKIDARITGWGGMMLSFAGRVQLIKSVLSALQVYWATAFILPKHIIKEMRNDYAISCGRVVARGAMLRCHGRRSAVRSVREAWASGTSKH
ncbi:UNVERIFIED_CONTAM: hypothetical protein Sradi_7238900 [Sesamum radiatum]|uniref:Reverse transcriptase n=1 Tax=Sesamum radiatum TaxID=300843 RepID=A0AAW2IMH6_SESRA